MDIQKAALALVEQCKELAKLRPYIGKESIASFCVVSIDVAEELLKKMIDLGLVKMPTGKNKLYE